MKARGYYRAHFPGFAFPRLAACLLFCGVCALIPGLVSAAQPESAAECNEGVIPEPVELAYGDHTFGCEIGSAVDLDRFSFVGTIGEQVRINVLAASGSLDPFLEIRDPIADLIASESCTSTGCSFSVDLMLPISGTYTLFLSDFGTNDTGDYVLQLERIMPVSAAAVHLSYDSSDSDSIDPATDIDFLTFDGTAGTDIRLNVLATSGGLEPTVEIRDPNGTLVVNGVADGASCTATRCAFSVDLAPTVSGTYSLLIYDLATDDTGDYQLSLWCLVGPCDSDPRGPLVSYVTPVNDSIGHAVDGDFFIFNGTAGTDIRLNVLATSGRLDPTVEIRDPNGTLVVNGSADGASCTASRCSFSVDVSPTVSGTHSLLIYDLATDDTGDYQLSAWCLVGDCDSDADGVPDGNPPLIAYGEPVTDDIGFAVDGDFFIFGGTAGDLIRFNVLATSGSLDPTVEIRDPNDTLIVNGCADGACCTSTRCSFLVELSPALSGTYSLVIYDLATDDTGGYQVGLNCLIGTCADATQVCGDNCIDDPNGPLIPDAGGNSQRDSDDDGFGNVCDPDFNNNGVVDPEDFSLLKARFGRPGFPDQDLNGNGVVDPFDFSQLKAFFGKPPGPSCVVP